MKMICYKTMLQEVMTIMFVMITSKTSKVPVVQSEKRTKDRLQRRGKKAVTIAWKKETSLKEKPKEIAVHLTDSRSYYPVNKCFSEKNFFDSFSITISVLLLFVKQNDMRFNKQCHSFYVAGY